MNNASGQVVNGADVSDVLAANHQRFLGFLAARVGNSHDAEEILQAAFVRSIEKGNELRDSESAVSWFYRLLRNAVVDYYRRRAANTRKLEAFARQLVDVEKQPDPELTRTICECIGELVDTLKPEFAELISLVDLKGTEVAQAAAAVGISAGNARVRLHRARKALRYQVEQSCRSCATHGCSDCNCASEPASGC